jgi:phosphonopyruvate decarboxylase
VLMSMRGWPQPGAGEQQHRWMGRVVHDWLASLDVPFWELRIDATPWLDIVAGVGSALKAGRAAFVLVEPGSVAPAGPRAGGGRSVGVTRAELVSALCRATTDEHVIATTGYLSRELFGSGDDARHFYMQGSMGHAGALALGSALTCPARRFVVLDGDGAAFMHLGVLATIGHHRPVNLTHVVFDNGGYESTGGQVLAVDRADLVRVALDCGYRGATRVDTASDLDRVLSAALRAPGPTLVLAKGRRSTPPGGRASAQVEPCDIADRFRGSLLGASRPEGAT